MEKEKEEVTLGGELRGRLGLVPGLARVPGPRTASVHIKVEVSTSGEDTDRHGGGGGEEEATGGKDDGRGKEEEEEIVEEEEEEEEEKEEKEEEVEPREKRAHMPGASLTCGREVVLPWSLPPGARSEPESPRAQLTEGAREGRG